LLWACGKRTSGDREHIGEQSYSPYGDQEAKKVKRIQGPNIS
jgi:hypothetical protein